MTRSQNHASILIFLAAHFPFVLALSSWLMYKLCIVNNLDLHLFQFFLRRLRSVFHFLLPGCWTAVILSPILSSVHILFPHNSLIANVVCCCYYSLYHLPTSPTSTRSLSLCLCHRLFLPSWSATGWMRATRCSATASGTRRSSTTARASVLRATPRPRRWSSRLNCWRASTLTGPRRITTMWGTSRDVSRFSSVGNIMFLFYLDYLLIYESNGQCGRRRRAEQKYSTRASVTVVQNSLGP